MAGKLTDLCWQRIKTIESNASGERAAAASDAARYQVHDCSTLPATQVSLSELSMLLRQ